MRASSTIKSRGAGHVLACAYSCLCGTDASRCAARSPHKGTSASIHRKKEKMKNHLGE